MFANKIELINKIYFRAYEIDIEWSLAILKNLFKTDRQSGIYPIFGKLLDLKQVLVMEITFCQSQVELKRLNE